MKRLLILCLLVLTGCSKAMPPGADLGEQTPIIHETSVDRKIIYTINTSFQNKDIQAAATHIKGFMGAEDWIEKEERSLTRIDLTFRIKTSQVNDFMHNISQHYDTSNYNLTSKDVSLQYQDLSVAKTAYEKEQVRIVDKMDSASTEEFIALNKRLSEIETQLALINKDIKTFDSLIDFSTVQITLYLKGSPEAKLTYGNMAEKAFYGGWRIFGEAIKYMSLAVIALSPILIIGGATWGGIILYKKTRKPKEKDKDDKEE